jgi:hypothetical protein
MGYSEVSPGELLVRQLEALAGYGVVGPDGKLPEGKHWWLVRRELPSGQFIYLYPCGTGVSLGVSRDGVDNGYHTVFDFFDRPDEGWRAGLSWDGDGEPEGWNRAHRIGYLTRRRPGGGRPETEHVDEEDRALGRVRT